MLVLTWLLRFFAVRVQRSNLFCLSLPLSPVFISASQKFYSCFSKQEVSLHTWCAPTKYSSLAAGAAVE